MANHIHPLHPSHKRRLGGFLRAVSAAAVATKKPAAMAAGEAAAAGGTVAGAATLAVRLA